MHLSASLQSAMNEQLNLELYSAYIYLAMSAWCEKEKLPGAASWLYAQAGEEVEHGMKFFHFINDRNGTVTLQPIDGPENDYAGLLEVFQTALGHEQHVTTQINTIYALAIQEEDFASQRFLDWFITEQVEEEKNAGDIVARLELASGSGEALYFVDRDLGRRASGD